MPALNYTKFTDKILSGEKCQATRLPRKHPVKKGDKLCLYGRKTITVYAHKRFNLRYKNNVADVRKHERLINHKLGEAVCNKIIPITLRLVDLFEDGTEVGLFIFHPRSKHSWPPKWHKQLALDDGFGDKKAFDNFLINTYKLKPGDNKDFIIIKWRDFVPAGEG